MRIGFQVNNVNQEYLNKYRKENMNQVNQKFFYIN